MTRKTSLPDRWDGTEYRDGCQVMPKPGPKVGMHWGQYLILEHDCRQALEKLARGYAELRQARGPDDDTGLDVDQAMQHVRMIEARLASVRRGTSLPSHICNCGQIVLVDAPCSCGLDAGECDLPSVVVEPRADDDDPF